MRIEARRVFRVSFTMALSLAIAYGMVFPLPFLAPIFALVLTAPPAPPMGVKSLLGLVLVVLITLGVGLALTPMLINYPVSALLLITAGLYFSMYLTVNLAKGLVGTFLTMGFTLIPAAGTIDFSVAVTVITALILGIGLAIACQWVVYPWFPEDPAPARPAKSAAVGAERSNWIALRATLIVLPPFLLALTNPSTYLAIIMKAVSLGQQGSVIDARNAGRELLGSTFLGGCFAILIWFALGIVTNLWMFFFWILLFCTYFASKLYKVFPSRYPPSFWQNVATTMLILLGSAVQDSADGKDVYTAFAVRMGLFIAVTLYAWAAIIVLEQWRIAHLTKRGSSLMGVGLSR
jgi:hypothetical protein